jgi:hypothetical protein
MKLQELRQLIKEELASMNGDETMSSTSQELFNKLESLLKTHDWTYFMSDDHRAYRRGADHHQEIISLMNQLKNLGYGEKAKELYSMYNK